MRRSLVGSLALALPLTALADGFGGFASDGRRYLVGADKVCEPAPAGGAPRCARATSDQIAGLGADRGTLERGAGARLRATATGSRIKVSGEGGQPLVEWDAGSAISSVDAVYRSRDGGRVAIEYTVRRGGRATSDAIALALPTVVASTPAAPGSPSTPAAPGSPPAVSAEPNLPADRRAARDRALEQAAGHLAKQRWARAEAAAQEARAIDPSSPRAAFLAASAMVNLGRAPEAIARLAEMARSGRAGVAELLVDAREAPRFAALRTDDAFRRAVGLDADPARPLTAYERLLGVGGTWEQPAVPCKAPEVGLALDRKKTRFALTIRQRCQGDDDATRLSGRFEVREPAGLVLVFPNPDAADERLTCALSRCATGDEDCLECSLDDLSFTLRVVRR